MSVIEKNYVVFFSPGTFISEQSERLIETWNVREGILLAQTIIERNGAKPYAFLFETRLESPPVSDGRGGELQVRAKTIKTSGMYFIDGKILTLADIDAHPKFGPTSILSGNMRCNGIERVVETSNGYLHVMEFMEQDLIVDSKTGRIIGM